MSMSRIDRYILDLMESQAPADGDRWQQWFLETLVFAVTMKNVQEDGPDPRINNQLLSDYVTACMRVNGNRMFGRPHGDDDMVLVPTVLALHTCRFVPAASFRQSTPCRRAGYAYMVHRIEQLEAEAAAGGG